jgi:hypothetical protein
MAAMLVGGGGGGGKPGRRNKHSCSMFQFRNR